MSIDTGNLLDNFILNTKQILSDSQESLNLREIYEDDVLLVPVMPSIAITCTSVYNELRTVGSSQVRYTVNFVGELWYYYENLSPDVRKNKVMSGAYAIAYHIIKNASLNNWLVNTRAIVRSCSYAPRARSGGFLASVRIVVLAPYLLTVTSIS